MLNSEHRALRGLRVIDFGQYIAGPMAAMILGDYGAEVIHIDPPGGPRWNGYDANAVLMRGKKNIVLDLKQRDDLAVARALIDTADIVIENFRPGVMERLGLGKDTFRESNPALIYCSIPGFSADDPRAGLRAWEGIVQAEAGVYTDAMRKGTRFNGLYFASVFAALMACHSILAALIVREKSGVAQSVEAPLYDACFELEGVRGIDPPAKPMATRKLENGHAVPDYVLMKYLTRYPCKDGRYIQVTPPPRGTKNLVEAVIPKEWAFVETLSPVQEEELKALLRTRTALEWEIFSQKEHLAGVVKAQTSAEWLRDDSAIASRSVISMIDPILGKTTQPGVPSLMMVSGDDAGQSPRHLPDEDRAEILGALEGRKAPAYVRHAEPRPPLEGIKVLDFCQVLAGPICGKILAEYGAEVIKINNPRTYENPIAMVGHETVNNGKKTTFIDLKSEEGQWILDQLIRECDVFHCNFSQGVYGRLGVTEEELRARNPDLILSQVNVHSLGGWRDWEKGHEDLGEAVSGLSCRYGGSVKPETVPVLVCDNLTGQCSAVGVLAAIFHRLRTGEGQRVQACLSRSATLAQVPYMLEHEGKVWDEPAGPGAWGWSIFDRLYQTADGYIFLAAADAERLRVIPALSDIDFAAPTAEERMVAVLKSAASAQWMTRFTEVGADARILRDFAVDAMEEDYAKRRGLSKREHHEGMGEIRVVACAPRLSVTPPQPGYPVCVEGGDTEAFVAEFKHTHKR